MEYIVDHVWKLEEELLLWSRVMTQSGDRVRGSLIWRTPWSSDGSLGCSHDNRNGGEDKIC